MTKYIFLFQMLAFSLQQINKYCEINNYKSGDCQKKVQHQDSLSFCGNDLSDEYICLPTLNNLVWKFYDTKKRDELIQEVFKQQIATRYEEQFNGQALANNNALIVNTECFYAYKKFLCQWNFPACDYQTKQTKPLCLSVCQDYFNKCGTSTDPCTLTYPKLKPGIGVNTTC